MQGMTRTQAARLFVAAFIGLGAWMVAIKTGERLPYLMTPEARNIRLGIVFPVLVVLVGWFVFGHRWRETGKTGYAMRMAQIGSRKERIKQAALGLCGLLLIPLMVAWSSIHLTAWVAYFVSSTPYEETFRVTEKKSVTGGLSLDMDSRSTGESIALRVPIAWGSSLRPGMLVCVQGRSSMFGTVIESLQSEHTGSGLTFQHFPLNCRHG